MYSREHALVSLAVGLTGVWALPLPDVVPWWAAVAWALAVGVGIDFDHFLVARLVSGDWSALARLLRNPLLPLTDPASIFADDDLWAIQRLFSHVVIAGGLVGALWLWDQPFAVFTAVVLYAHLLSDLAWDNYRLEEYQRRHAEHVRRMEQAGDAADADCTADADGTSDADATADADGRADAGSVVDADLESDGDAPDVTRS
ncbi:hypothetical protein SAMN05216559_0634 [Halomicrobium zhouii]|uniref:Uncharacterized protein n=1 Tax=Halomicrobium zhouii TaxID=767519 RepID=A0A1I6KEK4_9EURY|nr:hypothetical protein SAMN05216559_0634 [Halomicrobium zhouii]